MGLLWGTQDQVYIAGDQAVQVLDSDGQRVRYDCAGRPATLSCGGRRDA